MGGGTCQPLLGSEPHCRETNLDEVQDAQLTLRGVHTEDEVQRGVVAVDQLVVRATKQAAETQTEVKSFRRGGMQPRRSPSRRDSPAGPPPCQRGGGLPAALQEVADVVIPLQHQVESLSDNLLLDLLRLQEGEGKHPWVHGLQDPHALLSPR